MLVHISCELQSVATRSAGVSPANMKIDSGFDFKSFAGETPALPVIESVGSVVNLYCLRARPNRRFQMCCEGNGRLPRR
jgi:hypothetical protein